MTTTHADGCGCGCCGGGNALTATPVDETNPPGQTSLALRVGTHCRFLARQLADLADEPALDALTARTPDDPAIALLDAWSAVLDVLSFYQERIVQEGYVRTATERRSVLELARSIGYELRPGVAASTFFAFTLETAPGAPLAARIEAGTRAQSVPAQGQTAQTYETLEAVDARARWNAIPALADEPHLPTWGRRTLYLQGQSNRLQAGDLLLVVGDERLADSGSERWDVRRITRVVLVPPVAPSADPLAGTTVVTLDQGLGTATPSVDPAALNPRCYVLRAKAALFGYNAPDWKAMPASLRANYQGIDDPTQVKISEQSEWPGFTLADVSDPPANVAPGSGTGLRGEYFVGKQLDKRAFGRTDATVDFNWGSGSPDARVPADNFSALWTGWVEIPSGGTYTFFVTIDDGARLWINDELVIDKWADHPATEFASPPLALHAGRIDLRLQYFEHAGAASIRLAWQGPGFAKQVIPSSRLYPRDVYDVCLDQSYPKWVPGSWAVLEIPEYRELYQVVRNAEGARSRFTLSSKSAILTLRGEQLPDLFNERLRDTAVHGESSELMWATRPRSGVLSGNAIDLATLEPDLAAGRWVAVSGSRIADADLGRKAAKRLKKGDALAALELSKDGTTVTVTFVDGERDTLALVACSEALHVLDTMVVNGRTRLLFDTALAHPYLPLTVTVNANVAAASHGDGRQMPVQPELLGSGDGSQAFQRFVLQQPPLTFVSATTPSGAESTLDVRVDGVLWREAQTLSELGPQDRAYLLRQDDDARTTVQFGDGVHGARLPSGSLNVTARYRVGLGAAGNTDDHRITMLMTSVLGVKGVTNPVAATGGTDAEHLDRARRNAPLTVLTLDRIVSLPDFEDFAAAFTGVGKAQAVWLWDGESRIVHLTVSGVDGTNLDPNAATYRNLQAAIDAARPAHQAMRLAGGRVLRFGLKANVRVDAAYEAAVVMPAILAALEAAFGFDARDFGQSLSGTEVVAVMQRVAGVSWVDLDSMSCTDGAVTTTVTGPDGRLRARRAQWIGAQVAPGELLLLDAASVTLTEITT
jgi:hypothetical protein